MANYFRTLELEDEPIMPMGNAARWRGRKCGFIGDSWTWGSGLTNRETDRFSYKVCKALGMQEYNVAVSGSGYGTHEDKATFSEQLDLLKARAGNVDYIVVIGGLNDINQGIYTSSTILPVERTFLEKAHSLFPDAVIVRGGFNMPWKNYGTHEREFFTNAYRAFRNAQAGMTWQQFSNCIDISTLSSKLVFNSSFKTTDNAHPNASGHNRIAQIISAAICGSSIKYRGGPSLSKGSSFSEITQWSFWDEVTVMLCPITFINSVALTANTLYTLGTINSDYVPRFTSNFFEVRNGYMRLNPSGTLQFSSTNAIAADHSNVGLPLMWSWMDW